MGLRRRNRRWKIRESDLYWRSNYFKPLNSKLSLHKTFSRVFFCKNKTFQLIHPKRKSPKSPSPTTYTLTAALSHTLNI